MEPSFLLSPSLQRRHELVAFLQRRAFPVEVPAALGSGPAGAMPEVASCGGCCGIQEGTLTPVWLCTASSMGSGW